MITDIEERRGACQARDYQPVDINEKVYSHTRLFAEIMRLKIPNTRPALYFHPQRNQLYTLVAPKDGEHDRADEDEDREDDDRRYFRPLIGEIVPRLNGIVTFKASDAPAGQRLCYLVEVNDKEKMITYEELKKGEGWENWPGTGIFSRRMIDTFANIVDRQAMMFPDDIARHEGRRSTGWVTLADGRHALVLPSGHLWGASGEIPGERAHLLISEQHITPYTDLLMDRSIEGQGAALAFVNSFTQHSIAPLVLLTNLRSIMDEITHAGMSTLLRGPTTSGKTAVGDKLRNLTGRFPYNAPATAAFKDTTASMEKAGGQIKSLPNMFDDLVVHDRMSDHEKQETGKRFDDIIRSVANNVPVKKRQTSRMTDQVNNKIDACPVITCEQILPDVAESAINRVVIVEVTRGDIDKVRLFGDREESDPGLRGVGYGFISYIARLWDEQGAALADAWQDQLSQLLTDLADRLAAALPGQIIPEKASRLPCHGAQLLLALSLLLDYCADQHVECPFTTEGITADLVYHLVRQVHTLNEMIGGGDGRPFYEKILDAAQAEITAQSYYLVGHGGKLLTPDDMPEGYTLDRAGMQRYTDTAYNPPNRAPVLGILDRKAGRVYLDTSTFPRAICRAMKRTIPEDQIWEALDKAGLLYRDSSNKLSQKVTATLPGETVSTRRRYKALRIEALYPEREIPSIDPDDDPSIGDFSTPAPIMPDAEEAAPDYPPDLIEQILGADIASPEAAALSSHKTPPPHGALCPNCGCDPDYRQSAYQVEIGGYSWYCNGCGIFYDTALQMRDERIAQQKGVKNHV